MEFLFTNFGLGMSFCDNSSWIHYCGLFAFAELTDPTPVNKHRETQLKLQEKLREKLLNKQYNRFVCHYFGERV